MHEITTLRDETRRLLINRPASLTFVQIAKELNVTARWVQNFAKGKTPNPGVVTVESLNVLLKNYKKALK